MWAHVITGSFLAWGAVVPFPLFPSSPFSLPSVSPLFCVLLEPIILPVILGLMPIYLRIGMKDMADLLLMGTRSPPFGDDMLDFVSSIICFVDFVSISPFCPSLLFILLVWDFIIIPPADGAGARDPPRKLLPALCRIHASLALLLRCYTESFFFCSGRCGVQRFYFEYHCCTAAARMRP